MKSKLFLFVLVFYSCVRTLPDEELTLNQMPYSGNEIRIDGYYTGAGPGQTRYYDYIFFYANGVLFSFGYLPDIEVDKYLSNYGVTNKTQWHVFQVKNDTIHVQGWTNLGSGFFTVSQLTLEDKYYRIINDTTLSYETHGYKTTYCFKRFTSKPDSTNVFIK